MAFLYSVNDEKLGNSSVFLNWLIALLRAVGFHRYQLDKLLTQQAEWSSHIPKRAWRRHSAYLICLHEASSDNFK